MVRDRLVPDAIDAPWQRREDRDRDRRGDRDDRVPPAARARGAEHEHGHRDRGGCDDQLDAQRSTHREPDEHRASDRRTRAVRARERDRGQCQRERGPVAGERTGDVEDGAARRHERACDERRPATGEVACDRVRRDRGDRTRRDGEDARAVHRPEADEVGDAEERVVERSLGREEVLEGEVAVAQAEHHRAVLPVVEREVAWREEGREAEEDRTDREERAHRDATPSAGRATHPCREACSTRVTSRDASEGPRRDRVASHDGRGRRMNENARDGWYVRHPWPSTSS